MELQYVVLALTPYDLSTLGHQPQLTDIHLKKQNISEMYQLTIHPSCKVGTI